MGSCLLLMFTKAAVLASPPDAVKLRHISFAKHREVFLKHSWRWGRGWKQVGTPPDEMLLVCEEWPPGMAFKWCFITSWCCKAVLELCSGGTFENVYPAASFHTHSLSHPLSARPCCKDWDCGSVFDRSRIKRKQRQEARGHNVLSSDTKGNSELEGDLGLCVRLYKGYLC